MPEEIGSYLKQRGFELTVFQLAGLYCITIFLLLTVILETSNISTLLLQLNHCLLHMDMLPCFISLFRLDDTLPFVQTPNGNKFFYTLIRAIYFFFIAGSTSKRNKGNLVCQLVARAKKMRLPDLLGSPTLSREAKILLFSAGLYTSKLYQTSFLSICVFTTFS